MNEIKSVRGVYYDLKHSPYRYHTPNGECFIFSSQKRLDIYTREVNELSRKISNVIDKYYETLGVTWSEYTHDIAELHIYQYVYDNMRVI